MTLYEMIEDVKAEGIAIGMQEGAQQKAYETAKTALRLGMEYDQIVLLTGLSYEQIESIADELDAEI